MPEDVIRDDYLQTNLYMSTEMPAFVDTFEALLGPKAHADIDEFLVASPLYFQTYIVRRPRRLPAYGDWAQ